MMEVNLPVPLVRQIQLVSSAKNVILIGGSAYFVTGMWCSGSTIVPTPENNDVIVWNSNHHAVRKRLALVVLGLKLSLKNTEFIRISPRSRLFWTTFLWAR
jgi:hypothetical protein